MFDFAENDTWDVIPILKSFIDMWELSVKVSLKKSTAFLVKKAKNLSLVLQLIYVEQCVELKAFINAFELNDC